MRHSPMVLVAAAGILLLGGFTTPLEITFDDGPDGSGPATGRGELNNLEGRDPSRAFLRGNAHRTTLAEGRYGRAGAFAGGDDSIEITGLVLPANVPGVGFSVWIKAESDSGWISLQEGSWGLSMSGGALSFAVADAAGTLSSRPLGVSIPRDGAFHHLLLWWDLAAGTVGVVVDFSDLGTLSAVPLPPPSTTNPRFAVDFSGLMDELQIITKEPGSSRLFDWDPAACRPGLACAEEVILVRPQASRLVDRDYDFDVPVRYKTLYDPAQCTPQTPCPMVVDISGGFACADDYDNIGHLEKLAQAGLFVVAIDPYCEAEDWIAPIAEPPQYIAVKEHVMYEGDNAARIIAGDYGATGCSHGGGTVFEWAMFEDDHPARTFSRSGVSLLHCAYHHGDVCPLAKETFDSTVAQSLGTDPSVPHDDSDPTLRMLVKPLSSGDLVALAATREIAVSWGLDLSPESPTCRDDGSWACFEQGTGFTYSGRLLRDQWQAAEPAGAPTGYFVEDHSGDCVHCAKPDSEAFACGICFLRYGRGAMPAECPACLELTSGPGPNSCPIEESWEAPSPDGPPADGGIAAPDGGISPDGGMAGAHDTGQGAGCGCRIGRAPATSPLAPAFIALVALWLLARSHRPRTRSRPRSS